MPLQRFGGYRNSTRPSILPEQNLVGTHPIHGVQTQYRVPAPDCTDQYGVSPIFTIVSQTS